MSENMIEHRLQNGQNEPPKYQDLKYVVNAILSKLSEGILILDMEGTLLMANDAALKLLQKEAKEVVHQRFWDVFADDRFGFSMQEALRYGISHRLIYTPHLEVSTSFVYEGNKSEHSLILFLRDITQMQKLQQLANRTDRMKELGEMAAKLAHEIRNCLGGIRGFASLLFRDLSEQPHLQEMVGKIVDGSKSLEKLVTTVLVYARPIELQEQTIDFSQFLKQTSLTLKIDPDFPLNIKFNLHIPNEPLLVPFDADAMKRALLNLLINAVQAMPKGGELTLSLLKYETNCQISISDTGIGMSEEQLNSLYSPFFTTKPQGNGFGLVETKKIVQGHGGSISVRSQLQRGTTFLLSFPLKRCP